MPQLRSNSQVSPSEQSPSAGKVLTITGLSDTHRHAGAVLFTATGVEGPERLGMHASYFGGRGMDEKLRRLVPSQDNSQVFVLIEEIGYMRLIDPMPSGAAEIGYEAFVLSPNAFRRVTITNLFLVDPVQANELSPSGDPRQIVTGCEAHRRKVYDIGFDHAALKPVKTSWCR